MAMKLEVIPQNAHSRLYFVFHRQAGARARIVPGARTKGRSKTPEMATLTASQAMSRADLS
jgi:hypothetical protein